MAFVNLDEILKARLGHKYARMANLSRRSRRTDFGRWRARGMWFGRGGRSLPTRVIACGKPDVFRYLHGMHVGPGYVTAIDVHRGMIWVTA
jgi:hypothetical protein